MSDCQHPRSEIRRRVQSNGVVAYWRQCLICFQVVGTAVRHSDALRRHSMKPRAKAELRAAREAVREREKCRVVGTL